MTVGVFKCLGLFGNVCIVSQSTVIGYKMLLMFVCKIWARGHVPVSYLMRLFRGMMTRGPFPRSTSEPFLYHLLNPLHV